MSDNTEPVKITIGDTTATRAPRSASGAKRGRPSANAKHKANVEAALGTMSSAYSLLSMGAVLMRRPRTASLIAANSEQWQAGNREAFESSEKLASMIANVGQTSGVVTFAITNAVALFSIFGSLKAESADIRALHAEHESGE